MMGTGSVPGNQEGFNLSKALSLQTAAASADLEFAIDDDRTMNNGFAIVILHYCPSSSTQKKNKQKKSPSSPAWLFLILKQHRTQNLGFIAVASVSGGMNVFQRLCRVKLLDQEEGDLTWPLTYIHPFSTQSNQLFLQGTLPSDLQPMCFRLS